MVFRLAVCFHQQQVIKDILLVNVQFLLSNIIGVSATGIGDFYTGNFTDQIFVTQESAVCEFKFLQPVFFFTVN